MARAPDTPAILTTPAVGAMSAKEDLEELIKGDAGWGAEMEGALAQSGQAGLRRWCYRVNRSWYISLWKYIVYMYDTLDGCRTGCPAPPSPTATRSARSLPSSLGKTKMDHVMSNLGSFGEVEFRLLFSEIPFLPIIIIDIYSLKKFHFFSFFLCRCAGKYHISHKQVSDNPFFTNCHFHLHLLLLGLVWVCSLAFLFHTCTRLAGQTLKVSECDEVLFWYMFTPNPQTKSKQ